MSRFSVSVLETLYTAGSCYYVPKAGYDIENYVPYEGLKIVFA
jgi:hypothetical protein